MIHELRFEGMQEDANSIPMFPMYSLFQQTLIPTTLCISSLIKKGIKVDPELHNFLRNKDMIRVYDNGVNLINPMKGE